MRPPASSANDRLPGGGWGRTWALTLLLVLIPLAGWELWWRSHGYTPGVVSADESWLLSMSRVPRATTVALGTSRIQAALHPKAFQSAFGGQPPVNLALPGGSPIPLLEYLADSTTYAGLVIVEVLPLYAFDAEQVGAARLIGLIERYSRDRHSPARRSENWLRVNLLKHLVFRAPRLLPMPLIRTLREGGTVSPRNMRDEDRFAPQFMRPLAASRAWDSIGGFHGLPYLAVRRSGRPANPAEYEALKGRILRATDRIMDRGGTVVLLYMAACGERRRIEEQRYPRPRYWDPLARQTRAMAIATEDYPELSDFACWDGSHIDAGDAPAFARALGRIIREARTTH